MKIMDKLPAIVLFIIIISIGFLIGFVFSNREILLSGKISPEKASPFNHIDEKDIIISKDQVIIKVNEPRWASFTDTNSMDPVFDKGANTIQIIPKLTDDIHKGDIVSYQSRYSDGIIIHRVVETKKDKKGWYAKLKGDNNFFTDPGKVRFNQIKSVTIAIVY